MSRPDLTADPADDPNTWSPQERRLAGDSQASDIERDTARAWARDDIDGD